MRPSLFGGVQAYDISVFVDIWLHNVPGRIVVINRNSKAGVGCEGLFDTERLEMDLCVLISTSFSAGQKAMLAFAMAAIAKTED